MDSIRLGQAGLVQIDNSEKIVFKIKGKTLRYLFFDVSADVIVYRINLVETISLKGNQQVIVPIFPFLPVYPVPSFLSNRKPFPASNKKKKESGFRTPAPERSRLRLKSSRIFLSITKEKAPAPHLREGRRRIISCNITLPSRIPHTAP